MRGTIVAASRFYVTSLVGFVVLVGTTLGYLALIDIAFAALGVNPLLTSLFTLAMAGTTASAVAWLVWVAIRPEADRERGAAAERQERTRGSVLANGSS